VSSLQGAPRLTHGIDIVVVLGESDVPRLVERFPPEDFYVDLKGAESAVREKSSFNMIDVNEGGKIDLWMLTDGPFDRSRFARRREVDVLGMKLQVSTPEDTILQKLKWARLSGGSEKQFLDALRVYEVQFDGLDREHLRHWVRELEIEDLYQRLQEEASI
jgi:hypothetical protein